MEILLFSILFGLSSAMVARSLERDFVPSRTSKRRP
jgi:hypothetical protein